MRIPFSTIFIFRTQVAVVLLMLGSALPETLDAAQEDDVPENILSMEYSTDASGSTAFTFSADKALSTHDRIRLDIGSTYFPDTIIGGGQETILYWDILPIRHNATAMELKWSTPVTENQSITSPCSDRSPILRITGCSA